MKAINLSQLLAVAVLFSLMAALILFIAWACRPGRGDGDVNPGGLTARNVALARMNERIAGVGR